MGATGLVGHYSAEVSRFPSGKVTFVFTDIEGSTRLLRELGADGYALSLAQHHHVLRTVFEGAGGVELTNQGDGFLFVFARASDAVAAAEGAQAALETGEVRVRMGVHTGEPKLTPDGYVGLDVHKGARLGAVGSGGQVILSGATRELVEVDALDLGEHRFKDFSEPEKVFQLGQARFPPLRTISNTNLPRPASSFIGRQREVADVVSLVRSGGRLVTLSGPGGSGKTRLALESAAELLPHFRDGVFWVGLSALRDSGLVVETVSQILGARDALASHIAEREMLLVLDNFEQIVDASPELTGLLRSCPNLSLLVTSRELLRIEGELAYKVPPLLEREAVELFCTRAQVESDSVIESLCRRLDYLPLAVEVAAARTAVMSPTQILDRISERLDLFRGRRDAEARQQTLRATIAWSYDLLPPEERRSFARLAVFAGGCTADGAERVCDLELDRLQSLAEKSLIQYQDGRLTMLETVREFAREQLEDSGELVGIGRRHLEWFLALAELAGPKLRGAEAVVPEAAVLNLELDNIRAALRYALDHQATQEALQLATVLLSFWTYSGRQNEGLRWLEEGLGQQADTQSLLYADALRAAGVLAWIGGIEDRAIALSSEALARYRALGDRLGEANALRDLGTAYGIAEEWTKSVALLRESVALFERLDDPIGLARTLSNLGDYRARGRQPRTRGGAHDSSARDPIILADTRSRHGYPAQPRNGCTRTRRRRHLARPVQSLASRRQRRRYQRTRQRQVHHELSRRLGCGRGSRARPRSRRSPLGRSRIDRGRKRRSNQPN